MSQNGKLMPNLDQQSTKVLNLTVLQRIDPFVEEILMIAAHVTFYEFNIELNQWSRKDVEGSLFIVKRNTQPRFQFIVMNRRNKDNLVEDLLDDFEYDVQVPYLLYRNAAQEVNGIWFYNDHDCQAVGDLFNRILNAYSKVPQRPKVSSCKSEFEELEAVPSLSVMEGPLEPITSSTAACATDVSNDSFVNFFSAAMNIGNAPISGIGVQEHKTSVTASVPSHMPSLTPFLVATPQPCAPSLPNVSTPIVPLLPTYESAAASNVQRPASVVLPPALFAPSTSSTSMMPHNSAAPTAPPVYPPMTMQRPYGTPLLQPFPPPAPPPSLTPTQTSGPVVTRERVRDALLKLVQNDEFVDLVFRELANASPT